MSEQGGGERPIDHERLASSSARFELEIQRDIHDARSGRREISPHTARLIATALGRALGRDSALADFGRTGEGDIGALRDEYLLLYGEASTPPQVKQWIDWFGTHMLAVRGETSGRAFMNEQVPPKLSLLLGKDELTVKGEPVTVWLPSDLNAEALAEIARQLEELDVTGDAALRAYLSLPDVNAADPNLVESYHTNYVDSFPTVGAALQSITELTMWEEQLRTFSLLRGIDPTIISVDEALLLKQSEFVYDFVPLGDVIHVFYK